MKAELRLNFSKSCVEAASLQCLQSLAGRGKCREAIRKCTDLARRWSTAAARRFRLLINSSFGSISIQETNWVGQLPTSLDPKRLICQ